MKREEHTDGRSGEVAHYSSRSRYPGLWMPVHTFLIFTPLMVGFLVAGTTSSPIDVIAMLLGIGTSWALSCPLMTKSVEWTAYLLMVLFPGGKDDVQ